jgi:hypothetical protein
MPETMSFDDAIRASSVFGRAVLLGNGFSIARGEDHFLYSNLLEMSGLPNESSIRDVFKALETVDFERVMKALEDAAQVECAYGDMERAKRFRDDAATVREALIHAVREVHPEVHFEIPKEQCEACAKFLVQFDSLFTLNYDLLLYWVILAGTNCFNDGFGHGEASDGFRFFSLRAPCNTYYLHGALHLFLSPERETLKRVLTGTTIIDDIADTIRGKSQLPLIVSEGTASQKIAKIRSVPYLSHCYRSLRERGGNLFIFGHSVSESDIHIYDAICESRLKQVFFCVHEPMDHLDEIREKLARYAERRKDIKWFYVDAATAAPWGPTVPR